MVALKLARVGGVTTTAAPALKVARVGGTGAGSSTPSLKLARVGGTGAAAVILDPLPAQTVEPESTVTVSAVLVGGGVADSYTWRRVSGALVTLTPAGATASFTAPSAMPPAGTSVVIGVTALVGGTTSLEQQTTITVLPQLRWTLNASRQWVGSRRTLLTT